ncbi:MAG: imidazole glycerol phosphate synthase subunit HisH [Bacteroidetes bacterium]|nr:imidazole glycerol phosphate synthase subunit HisH [Bacteroidota bacterium]
MSKKKSSIVVIDYGMGNIGSISNMLKYLGSKAVISSDKSVIEKADKLILPGVGHFDRAMHNINSLEIFNLIRYKAMEEKKPILGICLGMQIMCNSSEEGVESGLSIIDASVNKFSFPKEQNLKVPHMGWNSVEIIKPSSRILQGLGDDSRFYFVHSYFVSCKDQSDELTKTNYGNPFVSSFERGNVVGVQFHPEKSHKFGITLFKNFIENY